MDRSTDRTRTRKKLKNGGKKTFSKMPVRPQGETKQQQQPDKRATTANMSLSPPPSVDEAQVPGALPPLKEVQGSTANAPLSPLGEELGTVTLPPLEKAQDSANINMSLSPSSVESVAGAAEAQVPGALPLQDSANMSPPPQQQEVQEMQNSAANANAPLSPSGEELGLGAPPPLLAPEMSEQEKVEKSVYVKPVADAELATDAESAVATNMQPENMQPENMQPALATATDMQPEVTDPIIDAFKVKLSEAKIQKEKNPIIDAFRVELGKAKIQLQNIEEQIENQLAATAAGGGMMKKRKKTFYKRYKSKKSMKRKNKTSRNN